MDNSKYIKNLYSKFLDVLKKKYANESPEYFNIVSEIINKDLNKTLEKINNISENFDGVIKDKYILNTYIDNIKRINIYNKSYINETAPLINIYEELKNIDLIKNIQKKSQQDIPPLPPKQDMPPRPPKQDMPPLPPKQDIPPLPPKKKISLNRVNQYKQDIPPYAQSKQDIPPYAQSKQDIPPYAQSKQDIPPYAQSQQDIPPYAQSQQDIPPYAQSQQDIPPYAQSQQDISPKLDMSDLTTDQIYNLFANYPYPNLENPSVNYLENPSVNYLEDIEDKNKVIKETPKISSQTLFIDATYNKIHYPVPKMPESSWYNQIPSSQIHHSAPQISESSGNNQIPYSASHIEELDEYDPYGSSSSITPAITPPKSLSITPAFTPAFTPPKSSMITSPKSSLITSSKLERENAKTTLNALLASRASSALKPKLITIDYIKILTNNYIIPIDKEIEKFNNQLKNIKKDNDEKKKIINEFTKNTIEPLNEKLKDAIVIVQNNYKSKKSMNELEMEDNIKIINEINAEITKEYKDIFNKISLDYYLNTCLIYKNIIEVNIEFLNYIKTELESLIKQISSSTTEEEKEKDFYNGKTELIKKINSYIIDNYIITDDTRVSYFIKNFCITKYTTIINDFIDFLNKNSYKYKATILAKSNLINNDVTQKYKELYDNYINGVKTLQTTLNTIETQIKNDIDKLYVSFDITNELTKGMNHLYNNNYYYIYGMDELIKDPSINKSDITKSISTFYENLIEHCIKRYNDIEQLKIAFLKIQNNILLYKEFESTSEKNYNDKNIAYDTVILECDKNIVQIEEFIKEKTDAINLYDKYNSSTCKDDINNILENIKKYDKFSKRDKDNLTNELNNENTIYNDEYKTYVEMYDRKDKLNDLYDNVNEFINKLTDYNTKTLDTIRLDDKKLYIDRNKELIDESTNLLTNIDKVKNEIINEFNNDITSITNLYTNISSSSKTEKAKYEEMRSLIDELSSKYNELNTQLTINTTEQYYIDYTDLYTKINTSKNKLSNSLDENTKIKNFVADMDIEYNRILLEHDIGKKITNLDSFVKDARWNTKLNELDTSFPGKKNKIKIPLRDLINTTHNTYKSELKKLKDQKKLNEKNAKLYKKTIDERIDVLKLEISKYTTNSSKYYIDNDYTKQISDIDTLINTINKDINDLDYKILDTTEITNYKTEFTSFVAKLKSELKGRTEYIDTNTNNFKKKKEEYDSELMNYTDNSSHYYNSIDYDQQCDDIETLINKIKDNIAYLDSTKLEKTNIDTYKAEFTGFVDKLKNELKERTQYIDTNTDTIKKKKEKYVSELMNYTDTTSLYYNSTDYTTQINNIKTLISEIENYINELNNIKLNKTKINTYKDELTDFVTQLKEIRNIRNEHINKVTNDINNVIAEISINLTDYTSQTVNDYNQQQCDDIDDLIYKIKNYIDNLDNKKLEKTNMETYKAKFTDLLDKLKEEYDTRDKYIKKVTSEIRTIISKYDNKYEDIVGDTSKKYDVDILTDFINEGNELITEISKKLTSDDIKPFNIEIEEIKNKAIKLIEQANRIEIEFNEQIDSINSNDDLSDISTSFMDAYNIIKDKTDMKHKYKDDIDNIIEYIKQYIKLIQKMNETITNANYKIDKDIEFYRKLLNTVKDELTSYSISYDSLQKKLDIDIKNVVLKNKIIFILKDKNTEYAYDDKTLLLTKEIKNRILLQEEINDKLNNITKRINKINSSPDLESDIINMSEIIDSILSVGEKYDTYNTTYTDTILKTKISTLETDVRNIMNRVFDMDKWKSHLNDTYFDNIYDDFLDLVKDAKNKSSITKENFEILYKYLNEDISKSNDDLQKFISKLESSKQYDDENHKERIKYILEESKKYLNIVDNLKNYYKIIIDNFDNLSRDPNTIINTLITYIKDNNNEYSHMEPKYKITLKELIDKNGIIIADPNILEEINKINYGDVTLTTPSSATTSTTSSSATTSTTSSSATMFIIPSSATTSTTPSGITSAPTTITSTSKNDINDSTKIKDFYDYIYSLISAYKMFSIKFDEDRFKILMQTLLDAYNNLKMPDRLNFISEQLTKMHNDDEKSVTKTFINNEYDPYITYFENIMDDINKNIYTPFNTKITSLNTSKEKYDQTLNTYKKGVESIQLEKNNTITKYDVGTPVASSVASPVASTLVASTPGASTSVASSVASTSVASPGASTSSAAATSAPSSAAATSAPSSAAATSAPSSAITNSSDITKDTVYNDFFKYMNRQFEIINKCSSYDAKVKSQLLEIKTSLENFKIDDHITALKEKLGKKEINNEYLQNIYNEYITFYINININIIRDNVSTTNINIQKDTNFILITKLIINSLATLSTPTDYYRKIAMNILNIVTNEEDSITMDIDTCINTVNDKLTHINKFDFTEYLDTLYKSIISDKLNQSLKIDIAIILEYYNILNIFSSIYDKLENISNNKTNKNKKTNIPEIMDNIKNNYIDNIESYIKQLNSMISSISKPDEINDNTSFNQLIIFINNLIDNYINSTTSTKSSGWFRFNKLKISSKSSVPATDIINSVVDSIKKFDIEKHITKITSEINYYIIIELLEQYKINYLQINDKFYNDIILKKSITNPINQLITEEVKKIDGEIKNIKDKQSSTVTLTTLTTLTTITGGSYQFMMIYDILIYTLLICGLIMILYIYNRYKKKKMIEYALQKKYIMNNNI